MDAANDAQTVWINTTCRKDHKMDKLQSVLTC